MFVGMQMRQNTLAVRGQTRDAMIDKQMEFAGWVATSPETASIYVRGNASGRNGMTAAEVYMYSLLIIGNLREWENSYYQFQQGLFDSDEFAARRARWVVNMTSYVGYREVWESNRDHFSPSFRSELDRIVADIATNAKP